MMARMTTAVKPAPAPAGPLRSKLARGGAEGESGGCGKPAILPRRPGSDRFGHDFARVGIHSDSSQGSAMPQRWVTVRGADDAGPASRPTPAPAASGGAAAASAALTYSQVTPPTQSTYGGYNWKIAWGLSGAGANTEGFVVQKIHDYQSTGRCTGGAGTAESELTYWEAWQVQGGKVLNLYGLPGTDSFSVQPGNDRFGMVFQEGFAKFMPNYTAPLQWGSLPVAGATWATLEQPAGWSDAGTLHRSARAEFNCCHGASHTNLITTG